MHHRRLQLQDLGINTLITLLFNNVNRSITRSRSELANEIGKAKYVLAEYDKIKRIIDPNARASYI